MLEREDGNPTDHLKRLVPPLSVLIEKISRALRDSILYSYPVTIKYRWTTASYGFTEIM